MFWLGLFCLKKLVSCKISYISKNNFIISLFIDFDNEIMWIKQKQRDNLF